MLVYLLRRLGQSVFVIAAMAVLVFVGVYAIGNPIDILINPEADQNERAAAIARLGLDKPLWEQFLVFVSNAVQGDLGRSFVYSTDALGLILSKLPATLELAFLALVIAIFLGVPLGMLAGLKPDSIVGKTIMGGSILGFSLPNFWQGMMLILLFAVIFKVLPSGGRGETVEVLGVAVSFLTLDGLSHMLLPAVNLALFKTSLVIRLARAGTRVAGLNPASIILKNICCGSVLGFVLHNFLQGMMLILLFAVIFKVLPSGGRGETVEVLGVAVSFLTLDGLSHMLLPAVNLALFKTSLVIRLARAGTREAVLQDYVKFARAKGLKPRRIVLVHIAKDRKSTRLNSSH